MVPKGKGYLCAPSLYLTLENELVIHLLKRPYFC